MASPQVENGYTRWANELLEALARKRLAGQEYQVVLAIGRKTFGFGKKADKISYGQLADITGLDRRRVNKVVRDLHRKKVLGVTNNGDRRPTTIWINKDYEQWQTVTKNGDIPNNGDRPVPNNGVKTVTNNGDHKRKKERKESQAENIPYKNIIEYLNQQADKKYNHKSEGHRKHIRARWHEGHCEDDFYAVIDKKVAEWEGQAKMNGYLRPETLFNGRNFDKYLNQPSQEGQKIGGYTFE